LDTEGTRRCFCVFDFAANVSFLVPIYEAKVSRDIRIVYQIDLDTDVDAKVWVIDCS
jgi:hypothetical protein